MRAPDSDSRNDCVGAPIWESHDVERYLIAPWDIVNVDSCADRKAEYPIKFEKLAIAFHDDGVVRKLDRQHLVPQSEDFRFCSSAGSKYVNLVASAVDEP